MAEELAAPPLACFLGSRPGLACFLTWVTLNLPALVSSLVSGQRRNFQCPEGNGVRYSTWLLAGLLPGLLGCHLLSPLGSGQVASCGRDPCGGDKLPGQGVSPHEVGNGFTGQGQALWGGE